MADPVNAAELAAEAQRWLWGGDRSTVNVQGHDVAAVADPLHSIAYSLASIAASLAARTQEAQ